MSDQEELVSPKQRRDSVSVGRMTSTGLQLFRLDPAFPVTMLSTAITAGISHMVVYGLSGNARIASAVALLTFPFSWTLSLYDAEQDFIKWKRTKHLRDRGINEKFMPYKVKYDWTDYEDKMVINADRIKLDE